MLPGYLKTISDSSILPFKNKGRDNLQERGEYYLSLSILVQANANIAILAAFS